MNKIKLGSVLKIKHGYAFKTENYVPKSRFRLVTLGNFEEGNNSFKYNDFKATYYEGFFPEEVILQPMDLIMPLTEQVIGLFGNSAFIPESEDYTFVLNQRVGKVVVNEKKLDKIYAHYLLATENVKKQLEHRATGTRQRNISPNDVYDVSVILPSVNEQKRIGMLLYSIEEKQKLNNKIISELESMAKTLYDYWFLQFDFPDENGKPYKSSGGKMVYNKELKRDIPVGWDVKELGDICSFSNGVNYDKDVIGDKKYRIVNVRNVSSSTFLIDKDNLDVIDLVSKQADKYIVANDSILIARSGCPGAVRLLLDNKDVIYCGFIIQCLPNNATLRYYIAYNLKQYEGSNVTKTGGSILQNVSQDTLKKILLLQPSSYIIDKFNNIICPIIDSLQLKIKENSDLASLRDFLLPMLMNGQVTFKE